MGNRAIIKPVGKNIGVYLHWNGGIDSVTAFLKYCELRGFRSFEDPYGIARFCQVVGNFFGGDLSIGIEANVGETEKDARGLDNGIYVVEGWTVKYRIGNSIYREGYDIDEIIKEIDSRQPELERLGEFLDAVETDVSDVKIGDIVFVQTIGGIFQKHEVVGIGEDRYVNGTNVLGIPYVNKWGNGPDNPNNYLGKKVRVLVQD